MFKTGLTGSEYSKFISSYHSIPNLSKNHGPFVYVDQQGIKLLTSVINESEVSENGVFAVSMAENGLMELLTFQD